MSRGSYGIEKQCSRVPKGSVTQKATLVDAAESEA